MAIILDTNFLLGLVHPKDPFASRAMDLLVELSEGKYGLIYTTNPVIIETCTLVAIRTRNSKLAFKQLEDILWGENKIATELWVNQEDEYETWKLFKKINVQKSKNTKTLSFVDVNLIQMAKKHQIDTIISIDTHFDGHLHRLH